jgi:hypothetical protein
MDNTPLHAPAGFRAVLAALLTVLAAGCGAAEEPLSRVPVTGDVTLNGQPLKSGVILFVPDQATAGPAAMAVITDGKYELSETEGPIFGHHRVEIEATSFLDFELDDEQAYAAYATAGGAPIANNPIPANYNRQSTLSAEVTSEDGHEFDYDLQVAGTP